MKKSDKKGGAGAGMQPLGDRVVVKALTDTEKLERTASGLYIPETVNQDKGAKEGRVVAVGEGRLDNGKRIPVSVKVGDAVLYQWGDMVKIGGEEYTIVTEGNILAVIK